MTRYSNAQDELSTALEELKKFDKQHNIGNTISDKEETHISNARDAFGTASNLVDDEKATRELNQRVDELDNAIQMMSEYPTETDDIHLTSYDYIQITIDWLESKIS